MCTMISKEEMEDLCDWTEDENSEQLDFIADLENEVDNDNELHLLMEEMVVQPLDQMVVEAPAPEQMPDPADS